MSHSFQLCIERRGRVGKSAATYLGGPGFKSRPGGRLLTEVFSWFSSVPPGKCLKLGHNRFLPHHFQVIFHLSSFHATLYSLSY
jgi:hypothetical protein